MGRKADILTAVELGSNGIKILLGEPQADHTIHLLGSEEIILHGKIVKGEAVNVSVLSDSLSDAFNALEGRCGERIQSVYLAVTGSHIGAQNFQGSLPITSPDRTVREADIVEATRNARAFSLPIDRMPIHSLERSYLIDGHRRARDPIGQIGGQLTADVHVIHGNYNAIQTLCCLVDDVLGFPADDIAFSAVADVYGLALPLEQHTGVLVLDVGAGVTEYVVYYNDGFMHSGQIAVGCEHLANDLSIGLQLPISRCRDILKKHGCARRRAGAEAEIVEVDVGIGKEPRRIRKGAIHTIMELRLQELFEVVRQDLQAHDVDSLVTDRVVLCGGGAMIPEVVELAQSVFHVPAAIGTPGRVSGLESHLNSPRYVTAFGLLHLGHYLRRLDPSVPPPIEVMKRELHRFGSMLRRAIRF